MSAVLKAPFPWPGGKSRAAEDVWRALGNPAVFIEPFAGSLAVLLARPDAPRDEIANDIDGHLVNFWRALRVMPDALAELCAAPVHEVDLFAREKWLVETRAERLERLAGDHQYCDLEAAAWWVHGVNASIGGAGYGSREKAVRQIPNLARPSIGIFRRTWSSMAGPPDTRMPFASLGEWLTALAARTRRVHFACGEWSRVVSPAMMYTGLTSYSRGDVVGVFADPPYLRGDVSYTTDRKLSAQVRTWALQHGDDPRVRIVLAGEEGEHDMPPTWRVIAWKRKGGLGDAQRPDKPTRGLERLWLSPHCVGVRQRGLFDALEANDNDHGEEVA